MKLHHLHPDDLPLFIEISAAMRMVAKTYKLPLKSIEPWPNPEAPVHLGDCSRSGNIRLVLRFKSKGKWTEPRRAEDVWNTAAHELAHLRHFNHGKAFQEFEEELQVAMQNRKVDEKQKIIDRIVKLQACRDGEAAIGNDQAAEAFAAAVNRMLIEHELNPTDLDYARSSDRDPVVEVFVDRTKWGIDVKRHRVAWQEDMARIVANAHLCTFLIQPATNRITFVGTKSHATMAEYVYGTLVPIAAEMAHREYCTYWWKAKRETGNTKIAAGFKGAWLDAFTQRIAERFKEERLAAVREDDARREARGEVVPGAQSVALVRLGGAMQKVHEYIDGKFGKKRNYASALNGGRRWHSDGRAAGKAAADRMPIGRRGIAGGSTRLLTK